MRKEGGQEHLKELNNAFAEKQRDYSKGMEYYKNLVHEARAKKKYRQDFSWVLYRRIKAYLERLENDGKPITTAGLILASGASRMSWYMLARGDYDTELYAYMDENDCSEVYEYDSMPCCDVDGERVILLPFSEIIEKAVLLQEEETETRLYESGRVGDIFALKAKHGWIEEEKAPHTVNQTLVIASPKEAEEAIKLLK